MQHIIIAQRSILLRQKHMGILQGSHPTLHLSKTTEIYFRLRTVLKTVHCAVATVCIGTEGHWAMFIHVCIAYSGSLSSQTQAKTLQCNPQLSTDMNVIDETVTRPCERSNNYVHLLVLIFFWFFFYFGGGWTVIREIKIWSSCLPPTLFRQ